MTIYTPQEHSKIFEFRGYQKKKKICILPVKQPYSFLIKKKEVLKWI